jgi:hypothetical protein
MIRKKPLEAERYINTAEASAALALATPIAEPTQTGVKSVHETTTDDGMIGLLLSGYASRFGEVDLHGEVMRKGAFTLTHIKDEWGAAERPSMHLNHGCDPVIGFRPIGETLAYKVDDVGLHVDVWVPREPDPKLLQRRCAPAFQGCLRFHSRGKDGWSKRWGDVRRDRAGHQALEHERAEHSRQARPA